MDFPIAEFLDEDACYEKLVEVLHPDGLACPRCQAGDALKVHRRHRAPVLDYRCDTCGRVFNVFTGTAFHKTHRRPSEILLILRGIAQGETTARLARELNRHRQHLLKLRHRLQDAALKAADPLPLDDRAVEADEMSQNAGEKRHPAHRPRRPAAAPREPAAGARQHGQRPAPGRGGGRARVGPPAAAGRGPNRRPDAPGVRPADDLADSPGVHGRVGGLRPPARGRPVARDGVPRRGRVGAG